MIKEPDRHLNTMVFAANHERQRILDALGEQLDEAVVMQKKMKGNAFLQGQISGLRRAINKIK